MSLLNRMLRGAAFLAVLAAGLWLWNAADSYAIATRLGRAGPDLWPKIVLALLLGAALWGIVEALFRAHADNGGASPLVRQAARSAGRDADAKEALEGTIDGSVARRPIFAIAGAGAMIAYVAVLPHLGYAVSTYLLLFTIMLLAGYRRPVWALLIAGLGTFAFFFVFQRIAYISLPLGTGIFRQFSTTLMALIGVR